MSLEGKVRHAARFPWFALPVAILLVGAVALTSRYDSAHASTFSPTLTVTPSSTAVSANSNITIEYELDSPSVLESMHVSFIPNDFGVADASKEPIPS